MAATEEAAVEGAATVGELVPAAEPAGEVLSGASVPGAAVPAGELEVASGASVPGAVVPAGELEVDFWGFSTWSG